MTSGRLIFRPLTDTDLPLLHRWLNEPGVVEFWEDEDVSWEAVVADYGSGRGDSRTEHYLALDDASPFGWIQCYPIAAERGDDEVEAWISLGYDLTGAGIDYLIGEPGRRGQGTGSRMIRQFLESVVWPNHPGWTQVGASPMARNVASCRALAKAGLELFGVFEDPEFGPCELYAERRPR